MNKKNRSEITKEISCRVTRTLLMYVREKNSGTLGNLLEGLTLDEGYLSDANNWVSHGFLQSLYTRMIDLLGDENAVYHMSLASERLKSLGILDRIVRLLGSPKLIYSQAPKYNQFLKLNGSVFIHEIGDSWVVLEDRYHDSAQKTRFDCDYTRGILAGIPTLFGLPPAAVEEIKCQVAHDIYGYRVWPDSPPQGCEGCFYRVSWLPKKIPSLKRIFLRRNFHDQAIKDLVQANKLIQSKYDEVKRLAIDLEKANQQLIESKQALESQQSKLIESERKYRILAENVSDIIWIMDLKTLKLDYISPSVKQNRGFTPQEAIALSLEQTLSPQSIVRVLNVLDAELANENKPGVDPQRSRTIEIEQSVKGGGYTWAEATVSFIRDRSGQPTAIMGVSRDISERKKAEKKIAESEKKYRNLFENGSDLLCIHDLDGNLLETNLPFKEEYGWRREDFEGVNIHHFLPERYRPKFEAYMARIISGGSDDGYLKALTRSGREVILEYRNKLILDRNGQPMAVQGAARDVTQRIKYEKALKESEEKYKEIVKYAPAGIFEFDVEKFKFTSVNAVMCEYTGYTEDELLQLDPFDLLGEGSKETAKKGFEKVISGQTDPAPAEFKIRAKDGQELSVITNSKFFFKNGVPRKAMSVVHDLTAIRQAEEERKILEVKLQNAKKLESLGTLAGGVAHDLNNILSGIVSYPELLLLDLEADSPLRMPLLAIKRSGEKAAEIVQDLLTLARRSVAAKKVINLNQIVNEFITSPEYKNIVGGQNNLNVETKLSEGILEVVGSETHISKTVMNLVANAADAMPIGGRIRISTRECYIDKPYTGFEIIPEGEYTILEISDMGIGMPQSDLDKIFEPFYTKKAMGHSGTGLGMSVVWGTVKDHDGFIDIITEEGSGTTFVLYFPASRSEESAPTSIYIEDYLGRGESILIIDDAPEQRDLAERMMQRLRYDVCTAASGEAAVALVKERPFDVLILDMIMPPGMNGLETYRKILNIVPNQKAVIASGYAQSEHVREAQRLGAGSYLKKPYTLEKMGLAVRSELDRENKKT
ncbi:PAS domain S-box protein [Desulfosarcina sp.]|uniref:PAS domain S-box protein n=1 Tax=Desulfosarcina sp. TaxID=2027861 RepID=UPI0029AF7D57|nr:PAS domain S-box protein [Desulfosarcina sp.]MDX2454687.1 PAS domain S-box protein [Desulfosarcina sp.]